MSDAGARPDLTFTVRPDGVARIVVDVIDRPVNTLRTRFGADLAQVLAAIARDPSIPGSILVSGKPDGWIAGADLDEVRTITTRAEAEARAREGQRALQRLVDAPKPVIAAVHGPALGGGFEVALACHGRVLSDHPTTAFAFPEVKLGLIPAFHGLQRLADAIGVQRALAPALTGKPIPAQEALSLGLADAVVARTSLDASAAELALRLAALGPPFTARREKQGKRSLKDTLTAAALEGNPAGRRLLFTKARERVLAETGGHYPAPEKILAVLRVHAEEGFEASQKAEIQAFRELLPSSVARRLIELFFAQRAARRDGGLDEPARAQYVERIVAPLLHEAAALMSEGVPLAAIEQALVAWGFAKGPLALTERLRSTGGSRRSPSQGRPSMPVEELQMRCVLRLVDEAIRCLHEGLLRSPRDGDLGAIGTLGFPAFRGGPFRYVDAVGPRELAKRLTHYQRRFGALWAPSPLLVEMAASDARFYP